MEALMAILTDPLNMDRDRFKKISNDKSQLMQKHNCNLTHYHIDKRKQSKNDFTSTSKQR